MSKWMMVALVCLLVVVCGCEKKKSTTGGAKSGVEGATKGATGSATAQAESILSDITGCLEGVTSKDTAEAAETKLTPLAGKLDEVMASVKKMMASSGSASLTGMGQGLAEGMKGAFSGSLKGAIDKVTAEIERISDSAALRAPLKGLLEQIQAAVKM